MASRGRRSQLARRTPFRPEEVLDGLGHPFRKAQQVGGDGRAWPAKEALGRGRTDGEILGPPTGRMGVLEVDCSAGQAPRLLRAPRPVAFPQSRRTGLWARTPSPSPSTAGTMCALCQTLLGSTWSTDGSRSGGLKLQYLAIRRLTVVGYLAKLPNRYRRKVPNGFQDASKV